MNNAIKPPPEWCQGTDLDNFVILLRGLKDSLAADLHDPRNPGGAGDPVEQLSR
ncbi:hypothetical protein P3T36_001299 [Kitasatospora sp. MAP12-15]|uniref:hypothetical protein n=1 Tax=unclassified Kitasatospora TaxID=2633591 RepID=UPI0024766FA7|nr:hypothetical protein [Kitasatospora sp. MAP12-44]MDH6112416.1 hypothetical protein [Kitasatospora sp. MAP12-44]